MNPEKIALIIAILLLVFFVATYEKWSYKAFYKRCEENSKHPDWTPFCGKKFYK
jgi:cytochrome bd-type quinol oxidase subunit 2